jgi:vesicle coat complex subunit
MRLIDSDLREEWLFVLEEHGAEITPRRGIQLFSVVTADPALRFSTVETIEDIKIVVSSIADGIERLDLTRFGVENPDAVQERYLHIVTEDFLQRLGQEEVPAEAILTDVTLDDTGSDHTTTSVSTAVPAQTSDSEFDDESTGGIASLSVDDSSQKTVTTDAVSELPDGDRLSEIESDSEPDPEAEDGTETDRQDVLDFSAIDFDEIFETFDADVKTREVVDARLGIGDDSPDLEWLRENRDQLDDLLTEGSPAGHLVAGIGFARLAVDDASLVAPYLGPIEILFQSRVLGASRLGLIVYREIAREDPGELIGHLSPLWSEFSTDRERHKVLLYDVVERVARDHAEHITEKVSIIASGLNESTLVIRLNAALILRHVSTVQSSVVEPYVGALVDQLHHSDRSGRAAAVALTVLSNNRSEVIAPYSSRLVDALDQTEDTVIRVALLQTIRELLQNEVISTVEFDVIFENLDHEDNYVTAQALTVLNELAKQDAERCAQATERYVKLLESEDENIRKGAALLLSTLASSTPTVLAPYADSIVQQLGTSDFMTEVLLPVLHQLVSENPESVVPHMDSIIPHVTASDQRVRIYAAETCGLISNVEPESVVPHVDMVATGLEQAQAPQSLRPLLAILSKISEIAPETIQVPTDEIVEYVHADDERTVVFALRCLESLAASRPEEVAAHFDEILPLLKADAEIVREYTLPVVSEVAKQDIENFDASVEWLLTRIREGADTLTEAMIYALASIAEADPDLVADLPVERYLDSDNPEMRASALAVLTALADNEATDLRKYAPVLVEGLESDNQLFQNNALGSWNLLTKSDPEFVADYVDVIIPYIDSDDEQVRESVIDTLERVGRSVPAALEPYVDTFVDRFADDQNAVVRDAALALGHVGQVSPDLVEPHFTELQNLLTEDDFSIKRGAFIALGMLARERPKLVAQATELMTEEFDSESPLAISATTGLLAIAKEDPARVAPHLSAVFPCLDVDNELIRRLAVAVIGKASSADPEQVEERLSTIVTTGREVDLDLAVADILHSVATTDPERVVEYTDTLFEISQADDDITSAQALVALSLVANHAPSAVASRIDTVAESLTADHLGRRRGAVRVVGELSKSDPETVKPYVEDLCTHVKMVDETESGSEASGLLPAMDALRNVAKHDPEAVEPYLDVLEEISPSDDETAVIVQAIRSIYQDEEVADVEEGTPDYGDGRASYDTQYGINDEFNDIEQMAHQANGE